jgi:hypothetical protein
MKRLRIWIDVSNRFLEFADQPCRKMSSCYNPITPQNQCKYIEIYREDTGFDILEDLLKMDSHSGPIQQCSNFWIDIEIERVYLLSISFTNLKVNRTVGAPSITSDSKMIVRLRSWHSSIPPSTPASFRSLLPTTKSSIYRDKHASKQLAWLAYVRKLMPVRAAVFLFCDCEFGCVAVLRYLDSWCWFYHLRQKSEFCSGSMKGANGSLNNAAGPNMMWD